MNVFTRLNLKQRWHLLTVAMSSSKQIIEKKFESLQVPYDLHISKYILYSNKDNEKDKSHWEDEIFDFLDKIQGFKFKGSNKKPNRDFIKEEFFTLEMDDLNSFKHWINIHERECMKMIPPYPRRTKNIDYNKAWKEYEKFIDLCCKDMETGSLTKEKMLTYIQPLHDKVV